jgi:hypothetical protein
MYLHTYKSDASYRCTFILSRQQVASMLLHAYMYMYICMCVCAYTYIHTYRDMAQEDVFAPLMLQKEIECDESDRVLEAAKLRKEALKMLGDDLLDEYDDDLM